MEWNGRYTEDMKNALAGVAVVVAVLALAACAPSVARISDDRIEQARTADVPLLVTRVATSAPNSAGGVDVIFRAQNVGEREIKYVNFTVLPFNRVGDVVASRIGSRTHYTGRYTGPLRSGQVLGGVWRNAWYNFSITCAELTNLRVTFMDDSVVSFGPDQIASVLVTPDLSNCQLP